MPTIYLKKPEDLVNHITQNPSTLIAIDFFTDWCRPCKVVGKVFEEQLLPLYKEKLLLIKIDADNDQLESLSKQFQVRGIPRIIFYYDQKIVDDVTGANKSVIETICKTYCK